MNLLNKPDLQIESVFKNVRAEVVRKSNGKQTPWESSSLIGDFYFYPENVPVPAQQEFVVQNENITGLSPVTPTGNELFVEWKGKDNTGTNPLVDISPLNRPVQYTPSQKIKIFWRVTSDNEYFLMVDGVEISRETKYKLVGDDLYVYHPGSGKLFFLKGFKYYRDNPNRKGFLVK